VTLPDMTPLKALRSARELVRYRRWTILLRVLFLPVLLLLAAAIIMVPIITLLTPLTKWMIFLLSMIAIAVVHSYMYSLYRELLHE
jgi:K+-sensing histidine kinase KdpD